MNLQYISDSLGKTTGVFIPINEWNSLKEKYAGLENEVAENVPGWQQQLVTQRLKNAEGQDEQLLDFDEAMDELENEL